jgi:hypothetical protein
VAVSLIGGGNRNNPRKPPFDKTKSNFIDISHLDKKQIKILSFLFIIFNKFDFQNQRVLLESLIDY